MCAKYTNWKNINNYYFVDMTDFFNKTDLSRNNAEKIISETLNNCDDGELYLEN